MADAGGEMVERADGILREAAALVAEGRLHVAMTQPLLEVPDRDAGVQQVNGIRMPLMPSSA